MSNASIEAYARALFEIAQAEGNIDEVENELFRMARAFESNEQLRSTLTDATIPADRRQGGFLSWSGNRQLRESGGHGVLRGEIRHHARMELCANLWTHTALDGPLLPRQRRQ